jgi:hypothetical protein
MDLFKIIQDLYEEKKRIDRVIGALEETARTASQAAAVRYFLKYQSQKYWLPWPCR